ncbi:hypothetical protein ES703_89632 [subsurface metagenome]
MNAEDMECDYEHEITDEELQQLIDKNEADKRERQEAKRADSELSDATKINIEPLSHGLYEKQIKGRLKNRSHFITAITGVYKLLEILTVILCVLNVIILVGTVIDLFKQWIGFLAYIVGVLVSPIFIPTLLFLPWFEAWVSKEPVSSTLVWIWAAWLVCILLRFSLHFFNKLTSNT